MQENGKARVLRQSLKMVPDPKIMVEVGCIRIPIDSASEGFSTMYLAREAKRLGARFFTVDIDQSNLRMAAGLMLGEGLDPVLVWGDGLEFLDRVPLKIDFLHLDGSEPVSTFDQFRAAESKLDPYAVVCVDDCHTYGDWEYGKGDLLIPYLGELPDWHVEIIPSVFEYKTAVCRRVIA